MKSIFKHFQQWLGWFLFFSAIGSFYAEIHRYVAGDLDAFRSMFICAGAAVFMTIWWNLSWKK